MATSVFVLSILAFLTPGLFAQLLFDDIFGNEDSCGNSCDATYALHTYEKAANLGFCQRGCRLFTIIDFVTEFSSLNDTAEACGQACAESYPDPDSSHACSLGCQFQVPVVERRQSKLSSMELPMASFPPLLYVHDWYSNMVDKISQHMSVSWSFYSQSDNGQMLVVRSEPKYFITDEEGNWVEETPAEYKTSNYVETNLAENDNSATPNLKMSQMHAMERDLGDHEQAMMNNQASDWLSCISKKTGLPRLLLTGTIFVSAFVMIWICLSSAVTAPDQRVHASPQKLSIYGDLEYLREMDDKSLLSIYNPQDVNAQAPPLPIKVKVARI